MATFLTKFFKIGLEERQRRRLKWQNHRVAILQVSKNGSEPSILQIIVFCICL